ncbi:Glycopeptide antibiotics resistance protein [Nonomuraea jiangxiensis]|uniref:Glycopeptide antibiotics resistance protein n=1 Tax=Nonomuraea jiangxiensis TaxID=633440 RepID=A0A1G9T398_9ACTN|nr:Glycopeptide antibiotics resistance protein [Nonomuraea jiangxiensis]
MARTWELWGNVIIAGTFALPLALLAILLLSRHRARAGHPAPLRTSIAEVGIIVGTAPWVWMILTPSSGPTGVGLVPFADLADLAGAPWEVVLVQVGGNLLVFAALGALLPVRSRAMSSTARVAALAAAFSVLVELLQYALRLGRFSSVDDVILNTAGAAMAALVTRRWWAGRIPAATVPR